VATLTCGAHVGLTLTQLPRRTKSGQNHQSTQSKTTKAPKVKGFYKLMDILYLVLRLGDDFVTR
jgi:hypothetical protein